MLPSQSDAELHQVICFALANDIEAKLMEAEAWKKYLVFHASNLLLWEHGEDIASLAFWGSITYKHVEESPVLLLD